MLECPAGRRSDIVGLLKAIAGWIDKQGSESLRRSLTDWVLRRLKIELRSSEFSMDAGLREVNMLVFGKYQSLEDFFLAQFQERGEVIGRRRGRQEGRRIGRAEGREEGRNEGWEEALTALRFGVRLLLQGPDGAIAPEDAEKLEHADIGQLRTWLQELAQARAN